MRLLRAAGAIVVGKTNVATMLADFAQTQNELYGRTNNPHDLTRSPGGSSGGSAAAVAAGLTFLDFGSDLAGSIRIPAAFCGVYGLRPTANTVPQDGFAPPAAHTASARYRVGEHARADRPHAGRHSGGVGDHPHEPAAVRAKDARAPARSAVGGRAR